MAQKQKGGGAHKIGRNKKRCERYRATIGKPRGPGRQGNKSGKNYTPQKKQ